ncbi:hypothetical protein [Dokdonella soli]|uniref:CBM-cenC domain-containing protein n=1 Tax=Dokdonella soli TaxID=529810 RepID=A0ABN1IHW9_9GAMM
MKRIWLVALALAMSTGAAGVGAANLLVNPDFNTDLGGWGTTNASQGTTTFDGTAGSPAAGSVLLSGVACCTVQVSQCVPVTAGQSYDFGANLIEGPTAPGQSGDGTGVDLHWYTDAACATAYISQNVLQPAISSTWARYGQGSVVAPAGAQSVWFRIYQYNFKGLANLTSHADHAFFGPSGTVPVELQSFSID